MKLRIEIDPEFSEEIIIRGPEYNEKINQIKNLLDGVLDRSDQLNVFSGDKEFFVPIKDMIFFETFDNKVWAHTLNGIYSCSMTLFQLEDRLPRYFMRSSKSCIVNINKIESIKRTASGVGEINFYSSEKVAYISRMYYRSVRDRIDEMRLKK